ncbi:hypothetical protein [Dyella silvae]|uniref:hypothetical protein n=1 Tax=Dyella silvae TaxID=2994424 RepID=UPI003CE5C714
MQRHTEAGRGGELRLGRRLHFGGRRLRGGLRLRSGCLRLLSSLGGLRSRSLLILEHGLQLSQLLLQVGDSIVELSFPRSTSMVIGRYALCTCW